MVKRITLFLFVIFSSIILFPNLVNAECSEEELQKYNKLVENIKIKYEHIDQNIYKVSFFNLPSQITITNNFGVFYNTDGISTSNIVEGFVGGISYNFVYTLNGRSNCEIQVLTKKNIKIPAFNKYSEKEICKNEKYYDFELCKSDYSGKITDEIFEQKLKEYEKKMNFQNTVIQDGNENNFFEFLKNNIYLISILIIAIILTTIIVLVIKIKKKKF